MLVKPNVAKYKETLNQDETSKQIATGGGNEVVAVLVTAGSSACAVRIYDSASGSGEGAPHQDSFLVAANTGESSSFCPAQAVPMKKGIYAEIEQGVNANPEVLILYN